jgi:CubicO group peptidase (beta-lactamase class C family)
MRRIHLLIAAVFMLLPQSCKWNDDARPDESPWGYSDPKVSGFDEPLLLVLDSLFDAGRLGGIGSMLVLKDNKVVFEDYYGFYTRDSLHGIGSMGNIIVSLLVGIAIDGGFIKSVEDSVYKYLPERQSYFEADQLKKRIRFKDILTMKSGLSWNETLSGVNSSSNDVNVIKTAPSAVEFLLKKPMESIPGQRFSQNSAGSLIILEALESATGLSVDQIVREWLFTPLQINDWTVRKDDVGLSDLSLGLAIKPLDLLKIGDLMLNKGSWLGNRIVNSNWVELSTGTQHRISSFLDIGYLWWRFSEDSSWSVYFPENKTFYALSDEDHYMFVMPEYDMVFLLTTKGRTSASTNLGYYVLSNYLLATLQPDDGN